MKEEKIRSTKILTYQDTGLKRSQREKINKQIAADTVKLKFQLEIER